jgi:type I restriction enzyme S subunit
MNLSNVCEKVSSGGTPSTSKKEYYSGDIPWLRTQEIDFVDIYDTGIKITKEAVKNSSAKWIKENCVIVAMYGATAAKVGINKIPLTTNQACCNLQIDETQATYRYVFHWLSNQYLKLKAMGQGSQSNINANIVKAFPIPVPPLEEQKRIVAILDRFDALCNDLTSGLPAEIDARCRQYEYYRDKLLTFKEAKA